MLLTLRDSVSRLLHLLSKVKLIFKLVLVFSPCILNQILNMRIVFRIKLLLLIEILWLSNKTWINSLVHISRMMEWIIMKPISSNMIYRVIQTLSLVPEIATVVSRLSAKISFVHLLLLKSAQKVIYPQHVAVLSDSVLLKEFPRVGVLERIVFFVLVSFYWIDVELLTFTNVKVKNYMKLTTCCLN